MAVRTKICNCIDCGQSLEYKTQPFKRCTKCRKLHLNSYHKNYFTSSIKPKYIQKSKTCKLCEQSFNFKGNAVCCEICRPIWRKTRQDRHPDKAALKKRRHADSKKYRDKLRILVLEAYGNKCICCNETNSKFLTIDHVLNDGHKERKAGITCAKLSRHIINNDFPSNYQLLCMNCNFGKSLNSGICPHKEIMESE